MVTQQGSRCYKGREAMPATRFLIKRSYRVLRFRQQGMEREFVSCAYVKGCVTVVVVLDMRDADAAI